MMAYKVEKWMAKRAKKKSKTSHKMPNGSSMKGASHSKKSY